MVFLAVVVSVVRTLSRQFLQIAIVVFSILLFTRCTFAPYYANRAAGGGTDAAEGEQRDYPYTAHDSFLLTQDVLRGDGILFEVKPNDTLVTLWKDADVGPGVLGSLVGKHPQYRYEIEAVPLTDRSSRVVVNVRVEDIPDEDIAKYKASTRLNLLDKITDLAAKFPPSGGTPKEGGVNYALLPNEDLRGLAKRATGNEDNWRLIAQDNGLKSPTDGASLPSIWIRNTLLSAPTKGSAGNN
jgi:hypothetical protein